MVAHGGVLCRNSLEGARDGTGDLDTAVSEHRTGDLYTEVSGHKMGNLDTAVSGHRTGDLDLCLMIC